MNLFDRYTGKTIFEKDLPKDIDFGRFALIEPGSDPTELTYSNFATNNLIHQELLLDKYRSLQDVLMQINNRIAVAEDNFFEVIPLIQRIKDKLGLNDFELMLYENVFHLEEIFRQPQYLLERRIEKVHVSRAKRIPSKSYQYLASHTEDWIHKSIVSFKPSRILNEELDLNFDIYENQLVVAFIERCLVYLNSRLKEIQDIKVFHSEYQKLLDKSKHTGWYKKVNRNFTLMGKAYEDENYTPEQGSKDSEKISKTEEVLSQLNKRLLVLHKSELSDVVNKRASQTISLRNTNVLVNHKHYRYVKTLWMELNKFKPKKSDKEIIQFEQNVFEGMRAYAIALLSYCLKDYFEYELSGQYASFTGRHSFYPDISFHIDPRGIFHIDIDHQPLKFIVIGNRPIEEELISKILIEQKAYLLYFSEQPTLFNNRAIPINPFDPDSCERVASLLKKYFVSDYLRNINKEFKFPQLLIEYITHFSNEYLRFNTTEYSYHFMAYPKMEIKTAEVKTKIENDKRFKSNRSRPGREQIINEALELTNQINLHAEKLKKEHLYCISCGEDISPYANSSFNYLTCRHCQYLLDSSHNSVTLRNTDPRYDDIPEFDWGMDYLHFDPRVL